MDEVEIMDIAFTPPRRGRRPLIRIEQYIEEVESAEGRWIHLVMPTPEANSVMRQIAHKYDNIETASNSRPDGQRDLWMRVEL